MGSTATLHNGPPLWSRLMQSRNCKQSLGAGARKRRQMTGGERPAKNGPPRAGSSDDQEGESGEADTATDPDSGAQNDCSRAREPVRWEPCTCSPEARRGVTRLVQDCSPCGWTTRRARERTKSGVSIGIPRRHKHQADEQEAGATYFAPSTTVPHDKDDDGHLHLRLRSGRERATPRKCKPKPICVLANLRPALERKIRHKQRANNCSSSRLLSVLFLLLPAVRVTPQAALRAASGAAAATASQQQPKQTSYNNPGFCCGLKWANKSTQR